MTTQSNCKECGNLFTAENHFYEYCPECSEIQQKEWERKRVQREETERQARIQKLIEKIIPKHYHKAHLNDLKPALRHMMLSLSNGKGVLLFGAPGTGKTHSMCALAKHYLQQGFSVKRVTSNDLCLEIRDCYDSGKSEKDILKAYQNVDKLFIEDIGTRAGSGNQETAFSLNLFFDILNYRLEHCKPTFLTSNKTIKELGQSFDARIESRLHGACVIIPIVGEDKRRTAG